MREKEPRDTRRGRGQGSTFSDLQNDSGRVAVSFFWLRAAERGIRILALSPIFDEVKKRFEPFDFYEDHPDFGVTTHVDSRRGLFYFVVYRCDWPTVMDLARDDDLVSELRVICIPVTPDQRDALYRNHRVVFKGIVHAVEDASKPVRYFEDD